jgi:hypothetical protein
MHSSTTLQGWSTLAKSALQLPSTSAHQCREPQARARAARNRQGPRQDRAGGVLISERLPGVAIAEASAKTTGRRPHKASTWPGQFVDRIAAATHAQSGRTYADRHHGLRKPAGVWRIGNLAAIARRRTRSDTQPKQTESFVTVTTPNVLAWPLANRKTLPMRSLS